MAVYAFFAPSSSGTGVAGLSPTVTAFVALEGSTSLSTPAVAELNASSAPGWYKVDVAADTSIVMTVDLDPGGSGGVLASARYATRVIRSADHTVTKVRAEALDNIGASFPANVWNYAGAVASSSLGDTLKTLCECVWTTTPEGMSAAPPTGSFGWMFRVVAGIAGKRNVRVNPTSYNGERLTAAVVRVYANAADTAADANHIAEFTVSASYDGAGLLDELTSA